jgi:hypothetical protein
MPGDPRECREHAKHCFDLAKATANPVLQDSLNDIGHHWMRLATELEATMRLLKDLDEVDTVRNGRGDVGRRWHDRPHPLLIIP